MDRTEVIAKAKQFRQCGCRVRPSCLADFAEDVLLTDMAEYSDAYEDGCKSVEAQLTATRRKLAIAEAALEHYADKENWAADGDTYLSTSVSGKAVAQTALRDMTEEPRTAE